MHPPESRRARNQHAPRMEKLIGRLRVERERLRTMAAEQREKQPELAARLESLILYAEGRPLHEIVAMTGLSATTVVRTRRRFECWGLSCVMDAPPLPNGAYLARNARSRHPVSTWASALLPEAASGG